MTTQKALNRKPDLTVKKTLTLDDNTRIEIVGVTARKSMEILNNKTLSDTDKGVHLTAAKILVNGHPVVYDDLLDCFTGDELTQILEFANDIKDGDGKNA